MQEFKKSHKLSVYLIKESASIFEDALKPNFIDYNSYQLKNRIDHQGLIVVGRTRSNETGWRALLQEGTDTQLDTLNNASNRAVLLFKIQGRIFALTFGFGKFVLNEELIERDFGLKTALNLVDPKEFISIDKANLSDLTLLTRTQSSRKSKPEAFNLDTISDLLRGVTGGLLPEADDLGNIITGSEGIYINPKINFLDIPNKLTHLKQAYESNRYKTNFDWIDNLKELKDPGIVNELKENLIQDLKTQNTTKIHLAPDIIINWENYEHYAFSSKKDDEKIDFDIQDYYNYKSDRLPELSWDILKQSRLYIKYANVDARLPYPLWRFINYETEIDDTIFVFTLGRWYQVNKNYVNETLAFVQNIEESDLDYVSCPSDNIERQYNELLANSKEDYLLFDRDLVKSNYYTRSGIEVCDVFSISKKEFVHVKPRSSSSTLSHLFAQGRVSSYALMVDRSFRRNLRQKLAQLGASRDNVPLNKNQLNTNSYTITFALIDKKERSFVEALPFFSLINFRLTVSNLQNYGYKVKVKNIIRESV